MLSTEPEKDQGRIAMRATTRFFLKSIDLLSRTVAGGDILRGVIFLAIIDANTAHLRPGDPLARAYSGKEDWVPDDLRRPVSVHALALNLSLPYETTRRHVNALIDDGLCRREPTGIVAPADVLGRDAIVSAHRRNIDNLRALLRDLTDAEIDFKA